jgi:hypothetical protein
MIVNRSLTNVNEDKTLYLNFYVTISSFNFKFMQQQCTTKIVTGDSYPDFKTRFKS